MLPDLPELKAKVHSLLTQRIRQRVYGDGVLSRIRRFRAHEGDIFIIHRLDGSVGKSGGREVRAELKIDKKDLAKLTPKELIEKIDKVALEMAAKTTKGVFEDLHKATEETGNVLDGKGQPFSFELVLSGLEKIGIDFDEDGKPSGLNIVVHPELGKRIPELIKQWEANPEFNRRYEELMTRKREDWRDRESRRKLVD